MLGLELASGGTFTEALTETLKESAMYKNVVKESLTFGFKLGGWALLNFVLYQGAIFNSAALQRFFVTGRSFQSSEAKQQMENISMLMKVGMGKLENTFIIYYISGQEHQQ